MAPNHFTELYSSYSTEKLVVVVRNADSYQPEAVEAAKKELNNRGLTRDDYSVIETQHPVPDTISALQQKLLALHNKYLSFTNEPLWLSYLINGVSLLLIIHFALTYFQTMRELTLILFNLPSTKEGVFILYFGGFIIARMVFVILFLLRFTIAWLFSAGWLTYNAIFIVLHFYYSMIGQPYNPELEQIFPVYGGLFYIFWAAFYGGILYIICLEPVRNAFHINKYAMWASIAIGFASTIHYF